MSYDLFLKPASKSFTDGQFLTYFRQRPHYTVNHGQAIYENQDTGVYFVFDYEADNVDTITFNLNYFRPHFFGLEAAPEVAAFISAFSLSIEDPQIDGMGDGAFSIEGFLHGWNTGNQLSYRAILSQDDCPETHVLPTADLERIWRWNFNRASLQNEVGDAIFVPKFMFMKGQARARTAIVWPDACPIYMPKVDLVLVLRDELSKTPNANDPREVIVVEWAEIEHVVSEYSFDAEHGHYRLEYDQPSSIVADFVRTLPQKPHDREMGLGYDSVLNSELVEESMDSG